MGTFMVAFLLALAASPTSLQLAAALDPTCGGTDVNRVDFRHVAHNNLGGEGPNSGLPEALIFTHVGTVDGRCVMLEMKVAGGSSYKAEDPATNGAAEMGSHLGTVNLQAKTRVDLDARFLECESRVPARLSKFNFTFYSVNSPSTRQITVRGYWAYFLRSSELFQKTYTDYGTTFVDASPCAFPVGSPECALTYYFQDANSLSVTLETLGPAQPFFFSSSLCGSTQLPTSGCSADLCSTGYRLRSSSPSCAGAVCTADECCERSYNVCSADVCGFGYMLKAAADLPGECDGEVCTREECCEPAPADAARMDIAFAPSVASCQGHERQWHVCEGLPECNPCIPRDCEFGDWQDWAPVGGCSGLCKRRRSASGNNECGAPCDGHTQETVARHDDPFCYPEHCIVKRVDCLWAEWSEWTPCQKGCTTCMLGQSYRERRIAVKEAGGGKACKGSWNMTRPCQLSDALDCKMTDWGGWTGCSRSCGTGWKFRMRRVVQQAQWGGKPCGAEGDYGEGLPVRQTHACNVQACGAPEPCVLDTWTDWDGCNAFSKYQKFRSREILMPAMGGNRQCNHPLNETMGCPVKHIPAPKSCDLSDWSDWTDCTATCEGQRVRSRHVTNHEAACVLSGGGRTLRETRPCGDQVCWKDKCEMSAWSKWSDCSAKCGVGVATRERKVVSVAHLDGCTAGLTEAKACEKVACGVIDCQWGDWEKWSSCTTSCGGGTKRRNRMIKDPPRNGGRLCDARAKAEVHQCNTQSCEQCIDGMWGQWGEWGKCSATCAPAMRVRHRDLEKHANSCGKPAIGPQDEYGLCGALESCTEDRDCEVSEWGEWSSCSCKCFGMRERMRQVVKYARGNGRKCESTTLKDVKPCNPGKGEAAPDGCGPDPERACRVGEWEEWSVCTKSCDGGQKSRQRHILSPAANDGPPCEDPLAEIVSCNMHACDAEECKDCQWGAWSEWGDCMKCGSQRIRHRAIEHTGNSCGQPCNPGAARETGPCKSQCEQTFFCAWTEWEAMGECSAECGFATRMRQRQLSLSREDHGEGNFFVGGENSPCNGNQVDVVDCHLQPCKAECAPQDCVFAPWDAWADCTCNQLRERHRHIAKANECGGMPCGGPLVETERCEKECTHPVDCKLGDWEEWSPKICGSPGGQRIRLRKVVQEPSGGGAACEGIVNETSSCEETVPTPRDCQMHTWGEWSTCSEECGGGLKTRERKVRHFAEHGGEPCLGDLEEIRQCNTQTCETEKVDCQLAAWAGWSSCDGMTMKFRIRMIEQQPRGLGEPCVGALKEAEECSTVVDCIVSEWTGWDQCDKTCGGGQRTRAREVTRNPSNGGLPCPENLVETQGCAEHPCESKDCTVSDWTDWSGCSVTCGLGSTTRSRNFTSRPCEDGRGCDQGLEEIRPCAGASCGCNDCKWGEWTEWSHCSSPCDGGQRARERHILRAPDPGCQPCDAREKEQVEGCNTQRCHEKVCIDGAWDEWQDWEACSASCKGGQTWRTRAVKVEANDCGVPAVGMSMEHRPCNLDVPCTPTIDCKFSDWSKWSDCSARCAGLRRRSREVKEKGRGAGDFCEGSLTENEQCQVDSGVKDWLEPSMYLDLTRLSSDAGFAGSDSSLPALMRFSRAACLSETPRVGEPCQGKAADLVVTPKTTYTGCDIEANGIKGRNFGAINVASGTSVDLEFRLVDSESGEDVPTKELLLKVFDLDEGSAGTSRESIHARHFKGYDVTPGSSVKVEQELSELTKFSATQYGTDDDDPDDPMQATPVQEKKAVAFYYEGVSRAALTFEVGAGSFCKTFIFAARACVSGDCKANPCEKEDHDPVDCVLGEWDAWGPCDATCGIGQQIRSREVVTEPAFGGTPCSSALSQTGKCHAKPCEDCTPIDCSWEDWSPWSACDTCRGGGQMKRYRHIASHPTCGGKACLAGAAEETTNCTRSCVDKSYCVWTDWQPYGACSATCGNGLKSRMRYLKALSAPPSDADRHAHSHHTDGHHPRGDSDDAAATKRLLLGQGDAPALGLQELDRKFEQLHSRSQRLRASRLQALSLAFVSGGLSLAAILGFLAASRNGRSFVQRFWRAHSYVPAPTEAGSDLQEMTLRGSRASSSAATAA